MKNFRVKVRDDKADFFEELMRYLDFLDYEMVEGFSEPRIYPGFEIRANEKKGSAMSKNSGSLKEKLSSNAESHLDNLREVIQKIDAMRDKAKK